MQVGQTLSDLTSHVAGLNQSQNLSVRFGMRAMNAASFGHLDLERLFMFVSLAEQVQHGCFWLINHKPNACASCLIHVNAAPPPQKKTSYLILNKWQELKELSQKLFINN